MRLSIERRMLLGFSFIFLSILFITTASFWVTDEQRELNARVLHAHQIQNQLLEVRVQLQEVRAKINESEARKYGFALEGSHRKGESLKYLFSKPKSAVAVLRLMTVHNSGQQTEVHNIEDYIESFEEVTDQIEEAIAKRDKATAEKLALTLKNGGLMENLARSVSRMQESEEKILALETIATDTFLQNTQFVFLILHLLMLITMIAVFFGVRTTHQQVSTTLQSITDAFFAVNRDWKIGYSNPQAEELVQKTNKELVGGNLWTVFPEICGTIFEQEYRRAMTERTTRRFNGFLPESGNWLEVAVYPSAEGISVYCRDISNRMAAEEANRRLSLIVDATSDFILTATPEGKLLTANRALRDFLQVNETEVLQLNVKDLHTAASWHTKLAQTVEAFSHRNEWSGEGVYLSATGEEVPVLLKTFLHRDDQNRVLFRSTVARDIRDRKATEEAIRIGLERLNHAQSIAHIGSWELDTVTGVAIWSDEMFRLHGMETAPFAPNSEAVNAVVHPDDRERMQIDLETGQSTTNDYRLLQPDGSIRHVHRIIQVTRDANGKIIRINGTTMDVTERRLVQEQMEQMNAWLQEMNQHFDLMNSQLEEKIRVGNEQAAALEEANSRLASLATTDGLTGLTNHRAFQEALTEAYRFAKRHGTPLSLALLDVDKFKNFNDSFGHPEGDVVLKMVAGALLHAAREADHVCRYGGEEFVILLPNTDKAGAVEAAERYRKVIEELSWPLRPVTASFGVATMEGDWTTPKELLSEADQALYSSKAGGRNRVTHSDDLVTTNQSPNETSVTQPGVLREMFQIQTDSLNHASENMRDLLENAYDATIVGWSRFLEIKDKETEGHSLRVAEMMVKLARHVGLNEEDVLYARWGALLHDVGKMGIPDAIIHKPGPLTEEEWVRIRQHTTIAYEMLSPVTFLRPALDIPHYHHEQWDGTGYPKGLKGEDIPLPARLFAVIDTYEALRSDRPYRKGWTQEQTIQHLEKHSGSQFDPNAVKAFLEILPSLESESDNSAMDSLFEPRVVK